MKKVLFAVALVMTLGLSASAQYNGDSFFKDWGENDRLIGNDAGFVLPTAHGWGVDAPSTPLGGGLLILTALGAGYALKKKLEK